MVAPIVGIVIVTHNSEKVVSKAVDSLLQQEGADWLAAIVDSGSDNPTYLAPLSDHPRIRLIIADGNVGFCKGNNIGTAALWDSCDYILYLNPDAFLPANFLKEALCFFDAPGNLNVGAVTGPLLGYNIDAGRPTGRFDSTGIFQTWYGRWYDRDQGMPIHESYNHPEDVPAICGALMFCRKAALHGALISNSQVFDNSFYLYKEDIDLSLRLWQHGWRCMYVPHLTAYHCRGWHPVRQQMPKHVRILSARNDLRLAWRHRRQYLPFTLLKYFYVRWLEA